MKLLLEKTENFQVKREGNGDEKGYFVEGIFLQANVVNGNKRVYPVEILAREVERYNKEMIDTQRAVGELQHPQGVEINPDRVSHKILSLSRSGNDFIGRAKVLNTPMGKIVKNFIDEEIQIGVSSRAVGSLREKDGVNVVQEDLHIFTAADIVMDPSAPNAFVNAIMESKEWVWDNGILVEQAVEKSKKEILKAPKAKLDEVSSKALESFLKALAESVRK